MLEDSFEGSSFLLLDKLDCVVSCDDNLDQNYKKYDYTGDQYRLCVVEGIRISLCELFILFNFISEVF